MVEVIFFSSTSVGVAGAVAPALPSTDLDAIKWGRTYLVSRIRTPSANIQH